ncbi:MAG: Ig-like domain-containing protein, partial [Nonlabens ulvanivorans]
MKSIFPFFLLLVSIYIYSCANQGTPTGGPRDTIPPLLLESTPENKSINYKGKEFKFVFDEKINADKLKSQLLITPHIENKYNVKIKKNELTLTFEDNFQDSTTYTLNFSEGLVDITEKNPAINLSLAFSTGHYIDSIYVNGKITNLYTNKDQEAFVVGLYLITDSLDILEDQPRYFTKTNERGQFLIENIKNGYYKIITFKDENKNLVLDPENESHGFLSDSIDLSQSQDSVRIQSQIIDANPLEFIRSKTTGRYFDMQYNKAFINYKITKLDSTSSLIIPPNNRYKGNTILRFYPTKEFKFDIDSLGIVLAATDTLFNTVVDTTYIKFSETSRKPEKFKATYLPSNNEYIDPLLVHTYHFDKPIKTFYKDSILISYDTLKYEYIHDSTIQWNNNKTKLTFETIVDKNYLKTEIDTLLKIYGDTAITDSIYLAKRDYYSKVKTNQIGLSFPKGTFISVEDDSTESINHTYKFKSLDQLGSVSGQITTSYTSFTLQLVNTNYQIIEEVKNTNTFNFQYVKPGKYTFRVMIDNNNDGHWSYGNILKDQTPEQVYFYPEI